MSDSTSPTMVDVHSSTSARAGAGAEAELAAHALGAELNRRQRVLDLVRQTPRDVAPRRHPLRPDERRHVVEDEHRAAGAAVVAQERRRGGGEVQLAALAEERDFLHRRRLAAVASLPQQDLERLEILALADVLGARADDRPIDLEQAERRAVDRLDLPVGSERHDAGGDPLEHGFDVLAALVELLVLALEIEARALELALAGGELPGHRVERLDERAELVAGLRLDSVIEVAGANLAGAGGEPLHRTRDALGQIQAGPRRADQNHERHHDEERQVDAADGPTQRVQLAPVLVRLDDLPGVRRRLAGEVVARQHHADDAARRVADRGAAAHELPSAFERLGCVRFGAAARDERREMVGGRPDTAARQTRRFDGNERHDVGARAGLRARAIDLDQPDASLRHLALDRPPHGVEIARLRPRRRECPCAIRAAWPATLRLALAVVVLRDPRRRAEHVVDRLAEPLLGAAANQLAADDEDEDARHDREAEQRHHELGAETRERQPAAALDHQLDDVARQHEDERHEHRQVGGRERVEHDLGQEIAG